MCMSFNFRRRFKERFVSGKQEKKYKPMLTQTLVITMRHWAAMKNRKVSN